MAVEYLDESAALIYSEILDQVQQLTATKPDGFSFSQKVRDGITSWYLQHASGAQRKQFYIGRDDQGAQEKIEQQKEFWEQAKPSFKKLEKLTSMAIAGGCAPISHQAFKVLTLLEQARLFEAGCVITGSYAFQAYANMLGISWSTRSTINLATEECLIAVPSEFELLGDHILVPDKLLAICALNSNHPSTTYRIRGKQFRVDFTTSVKPNSLTSEPTLFLPELKTYAEGLPFLDFLLENNHKAVLLSKSGVLVNVPDPARFALHNLVISSTRLRPTKVKARNDVAQATRLIEVLLKDRPGDLWRAIDAAKNHPSVTFKQMLTKALSKLPDQQGATLIEYWNSL